jgi:hypothetical protein
MRALIVAVLLTACVGEIPEGQDHDGPPPDDPGDTGPEPEELPDGTPIFQLPFKCGEVWAGQTRTNHSPPPSVDFNRTDDLGQPVLASAAGVITRVDDEGGSSYGKWIEINHGNGHRSRYAHLDTQIVSVNQSVKRGQQIGTLGNTGGSSGPHLHYEQRKDGATVRASFNSVEALYYGTKNYTSANGCTGGGGGGGDDAVGRITTGGSSLSIHADASNASAVVGSVADATQVTISCQKQGESVTGTYGTSTLWDKIGTGFVPDTYVSTGSDGQVAPTCP